MGNDCEELARGDYGSLGSAKHKLPKKLEEAMALRTAMLVAKHQGWRTMEFETDCKHVIDGINREKEDVAIAIVVSDIKKH